MSVDEWMNNQSKMLAALAQYRSRSDVSMADYALYRAALRTGLLDRHFANKPTSTISIY
jgi:hypothetical protein